MEQRRLDILPSWLEDAASFDQSTSIDMATIYWTVLVNSISLFFFVWLYSYIRMTDDKLFASRVGLKPDSCPPRFSNDTLFGWMKELWNVTDATILEKGGFDILTFIRFYRLNCKIFLIFSVYAFSVLLPINVTDAGDSTSQTTDTFQVWSMSNISQGSWRCWYHLLGLYLLTAIMIYFLEKEFMLYASNRHKYLRQHHVHLRTVLVEGIPFKMRSNVTLGLYFEVMYPNGVQRTQLGQNIQTLEGIITDRSAALVELEKALYENHNTSKRPTVKVGNMSQEVDAIRHYAKVVGDLNEVVTKEQELALSMAKSQDTLSDEEAIHIIEKLLKVTQIGSIEKLLKGRLNGNMQQACDTSSSSSSSRGYGTAPGRDQVETEIGELGHYENESDELDDEEDEEYSVIHQDVQSQPLRNWMSAIWNAQSMDDRMAIIRGDIEGTSDENSTLIRSVTERSMFLPKAFITFKTFTAATVARQIIHMQKFGHIAVSEAPEPRDIYWQNLYYTRKGTLFRKFLVESFVATLILFWIVPVTFVAIFTNSDFLLGKIPLLATLCTYSNFFTSLVALVQPSMLLGIMQFLPPLFNILGVFEGQISFSSNQFKAFDRYFMFQVINVFLVTTLSGSVIDAITSIIVAPAEAFSLLGQSLPKMGGYFTIYIFAKAFIGLGMEIVRLPAVCMEIMKRVFTSNVTLRQRTEYAGGGSMRFMDNPGWLPFAKLYAQDTLVVVLCATFACIAPLLLMAGICYFGGASLIYTHQLLFVYEDVYETGGRWWPKIARCMVVALLFAQSTMVGMMILKESYQEIYFLALLIAGTLFYYWHMITYYEPLAEQLPFDIATSMDLDMKDEENIEGVEQYVQPALQPTSKSVLHPMTEFPVDHGDVIAGSMEI